ncbi:GNAT family N-acetyltransferase [Candidatus Woesearchaeota archaeon]|nr:GNAT family N-acetyltransferase [Candidatus Woesearchaeota archaeon]
MTFTIRKAGKHDNRQIKKIDTFGKQLNSFRGLDKIYLNYKPKKGARSYYERFIHGRKKWCYVADEDGKILGFVLFNIEKRQGWYRIQRIGYIDLLVVEKKARKKGIATRLLDKAVNIFRDEGIRYLKLSTHMENPAHEFWKKKGFRDYRIDMWKKI